MDIYNIDNHKLHYHPGPVSKWLAGKKVYPIYMEISPTNACNYDCGFCALNYRRRNLAYLPVDLLYKNLEQMKAVGVRSIMYAGEGEPLLHPNITEMISDTKAVGIDVSMLTNGSLLDKHDVVSLLNNLSWLRVSLNAAFPESYKKVHGVSENNFEKVIENIKILVKTKKEINSSCTIGVQSLLLEDNAGDMLELAAICKKLKVDYFSVKPYSDHPLDSKPEYAKTDYSQFLDLNKKLSYLENDEYKIIFREQTMLKHKSKKKYDQCFGIEFFTYLDHSANLIPCVSYVGEEGYCYGNLNDKSFKMIWESQSRRSILEKINASGLSKCRRVCRMDEINMYLWRLKYPEPHDNFI